LHGIVTRDREQVGWLGDFGSHPSKCFPRVPLNPIADDGPFVNFGCYGDGQTTSRELR
jgi:hypothetical protein